MSGDSLDYAYFRLQTLAEDIQNDMPAKHAKKTRNQLSRKFSVLSRSKQTQPDS